MKGSKKPKSKRKLFKKYLLKWLKPLGLLWWGVDVRYYNDPDEIVRIFHSDEDNKVVAALTTVFWKYNKATIDVNLLALEKMDKDGIEVCILHELIHILVNEMREGELHHEERVVTNLQRAFLWTEQEFSCKGT
jgi:hypothetical protein